MAPADDAVIRQRTVAAVIERPHSAKAAAAEAIALRDLAAAKRAAEAAGKELKDLPPPLVYDVNYSAVERRPQARRRPLCSAFSWLTPRNPLSPVELLFVLHWFVIGLDWILLLNC